MQLLTELTIFILSVFVGLEVISKVPTMLHTPLMSVIVVILASLNVFGGFVVTERMLQMFKPRATPGQDGTKK
jgi:NAD(P) transhydrogenase subunit alpha